MLSWLRNLFERHEIPREIRGPVSPVRVVHDDKTITVRQPGGREETIAWSDLASVTVLTTDHGPFEIDLFWVFRDRNGHRGPVVPMGAAGEHELLKAMQSRLHGFDNMAVVEAMGATSNASFVIWEHPRREVGGGG
jgi:hypothetical protein